MKVISYEFPHEKEVSYIRKQDMFMSFILITIETEEYGEITYEVEWYKTCRSSKWRIKDLRVLHTDFCISYFHTFNKKVKKYLYEEGVGIKTFLITKEQEIRNHYVSVPRISILQIEKTEESMYKKGRYRQVFRMKLAPFDKFFTVTIGKGKGAKTVWIHLKQRKKEGNEMDFLWYPGWSGDFNHLVLEFWLSLEKDLLTKGRKKQLYEHTLQHIL